MSRVIQGTLPLWLVLALLGGMFDARSVRADDADKTIEVISVVTTTTDLASIAKEVGGEHVQVLSLIRGPVDPRSVQVKPMMNKQLAGCEVFFINGLDLESTWLRKLRLSMDNPDFAAGGNLVADVSTVIQPLNIPPSASQEAATPVPNPHFLLDPLNAIKVAGLMRDRYIKIHPSAKEDVDKQYEAFAKKIGTSLIGEELAKTVDPMMLADLSSQGKLEEYVRKHKIKVGGWLGKILPYSGDAVVCDQDTYQYLAFRFGIRIVGVIEKDPDATMTTRDLQKLIETMKTEHVGAILSSPYYDIDGLRNISRQSGVQIVPMAHQVGAQDLTTTYFKMMDYNIDALVRTLKGNH